MADEPPDEAGVDVPPDELEPLPHPASSAASAATGKANFVIIVM